jgi:hypothetical protein
VVSFTGLPSVADRTLFTDRGPIVKNPEPVLTGANLQILSTTTIEVPTANFTSSYDGYQLVISGSPSGRNDGIFLIGEVLSNTRLSLQNASFDTTDEDQTIDSIIALANNLRSKYEAHRVADGIHGTNDTTNTIVAAAAIDLASAITLLNDIKAKFNAHIIMVSGDPPVHTEADTDNEIYSINSSQLASAVILVNEIRKRYENHRMNRIIHLDDDLDNRVTVAKAEAVTGTYPSPFTGPFNWTLQNPRFGIVADDPTDVQVYVNGAPATSEAVYGLLGAVVLAAKPSSTDIVTIDYNYIENPPARFARLNSFEFNLNQWGNNGLSGFPHHRYRVRSFLLDPSRTPDLISPFSPLQKGWRYKGLEREYSAVLNDPNLLLTNVPNNRVAYPVLVERIPEVTIRYDPTTLPQDASDPWTLEGEGTFSLAAGGNELTIIDSNIQTGPDSKPPFFSHEIDVRADSIVSAAFRHKISETEPDGVFTGVAFGITGGKTVAIAGFIITEAVNLSSAIKMANDVRAKFEAHLTNLGSHDPNDTSDILDVVNASDLTSLVILVNNLKEKFNSHLSKGGGSGLVHDTVDIINPIVTSDASDLSSSLILTNDLRDKFNAHRTQTSVHFVGDNNNEVGEVKQIGILKNTGFPEFAESWEAYAIDWSEYLTYRLCRDENANAKLYVSASVDPIISVGYDDLPAPSDIDAKFDPIQQTFFGSIRRDATSTSHWQFIRINIAPVSADLIEDNKSVDYDASVVPERDPVAPWITIGQGGNERVLTGDILLLDSTAKAAEEDISALGLSTGAYRGFIRFEPILSINTAASVEFKTAVDYYTFSLSNQQAGVFLEDNNLSVQLLFLQYSPSAANVTGTVTEPYVIITDDQFIFKIGDSADIVVTFLGTDTTAAAVSARINAALATALPPGFTFATDEGGRVKLTLNVLGSATSFEIVSGSSLAKLGFSPGVYIGRDSNPEPKVSWFGADFPSQDDPTWNASGTQSATMLGRTLRITDNSTSDYLTYNLTDPIVTNQAFNPSVNWKLDARLVMRSFIVGDALPTVAPFLTLYFCGALTTLDEGPGGKNIELHLSIDIATSDPYLNLVSYDSGANSLDVVGQYAFDWNDGQVHTYNIYTSKAADSIFVYADGILLVSIGPAPTYSGLNSSYTSQFVSFGSGSEPVTASNIGAAQSVVDWESVAVFRDSNLEDATAADRRYIGIYKGGDAELLASYYLYQIDWTTVHTYRIIRDPLTAVSVYVDGGDTPVISVAYDILTLPPAATSFFNEITSDLAIVAFGSFSSEEISRTRWEYVQYSIGKITLTDRLVPPHHWLNQGNAIASPDHLYTKIPHFHQGMRVYSGGTPLEDFLADEDAESFTVLGEGTVPVPMTQDLDSRGGLVKVGTPLKGIPPTDLVNTNGYISNLQDDTTNVLTASGVTNTTAALSELIALANSIQTNYNAHLTEVGVHNNDDTVNNSVAAIAADLATAITLLNELKSVYNTHREELAGPGIVHDPLDSVNIVSTADATDLVSAVALANDIKAQYTSHINTGNIHNISDSFNIVTAAAATDLATAVTLAEDIKTQFISHFTNVSGAFHSVADNENAIINDEIVQGGPPSPIEVGTVLVATLVQLTNTLKARYNSHRIKSGVHVTDDDRYELTTDDAYDLATTIVLLNDIKARYNSHRIGMIYHAQIDTNNPVTATDASDPLALSIAALNDFREKYLLHVIQRRVHLANDDENVVLTEEATDLTTAIDLANSSKEEFNDHIAGVIKETQEIHSEDDTVNTIISSDATDLASLASLAEEIRVNYEAHRVQDGVHGASLFIRLDPPSRILYNSMKFWEFDEGVEGLEFAPFSDDETYWIIGPTPSDVSFSYDGNVLPGNDRALAVANLANDVKAQYNAHRVAVGVHPVNDLTNIVTAPNATDLTTAMILLADIKTQYNAHLTEAGVHSTDDEENASIYTDAIELYTSLALVNEIKMRYETHRQNTTYHLISDDVNVVTVTNAPPVQDPGWRIIEDGPDSPTVSLVAGPPTAIRYTAVGSSSTSLCRNDSAIPDTPDSFELTVSLRINAFPAGTDIDTSIYAGFLSSINPGIAAAVGFDVVNNIPYVKIQDVNADETVYRAPFDWSDGNYHTYKLIRDAVTNTIGLIIVS